MHHYFRGLLLVITSLVPSRSNIISRAAEQNKFAMPVFVDFVISDSSDGKRTACRIHIVDGAGTACLWNCRTILGRSCRIRRLTRMQHTEDRAFQ